MSFNHPYNNVFATAVASNALAQHAVGFANAGRIAKKKLEDALLLFRGNLFQPLFWALLHESIVI